MKSYRQIFRSSAVIGSASLINILVGIIKVKVLALLLGPAGIAIMGLYQSTMATATTLFGCGLEGSGVRQVAAAQNDKHLLALIRRSLEWASVLLGAAGMLLLWLLRESLSQWVFHDTTHASQIGWLGLGVFLSILVSAQTALLQGLRRIDDVARVNVLGAVLGAAAGVALIYLLGESGLHWFVIVAPAASLVFSFWYAARVPRHRLAYDWRALRRQWQVLFSLGIPLMAAGLLTLITQLVVRGWVIRDLGLDAGGYFQAAWSISMTYLGFVLAAMAVDYLPRLTGVMPDYERAKTLVNEQTEMALLMAAPVLLAMMTLAPWLIQLLYAASFAPAAEIFRWHVMGDIFKVIGWPMGFIVLAMGRGDLFIATQLNWNVIYLLSLWLGMKSMGLLGVGIAFLVAYIFQVALVRVVVGKLIGFSSEWKNLRMFAAMVGASGAVLLLDEYEPGYVVPIGLAMTALSASYSIWRLNRLLDLHDVMKRYGWRRDSKPGNSE